MGPRLLVVGPAEKVCKYEGHAHSSGRQRDTRPRGARFQACSSHLCGEGSTGQRPCCGRQDAALPVCPVQGPLWQGGSSESWPLPG